MIRIAKFATSALLFAVTVESRAASTIADAANDGNFPPAVANWLDEARRSCPVGFEAKGAVEQADLTGEGRPAFIANPHRLSCAGSPHVFGGDGAAPIELFVTLRSGETVHAGSVLAIGYKIRPSPNGGAPVIEFQTHDPDERAGSFDRYRWDGRSFSMQGRNSMAAPPVDGPDQDFQK